MEQFGSMRNNWEGIYERYIQYIKPHLKNMRSSTSFLITKLEQIHSSNVLNHILMDKTPSGYKKYNRFRHVHVYKDNKVIDDDINEDKCIVAIKSKTKDSNCVYCVIKRKGQKFNYGRIIIDDSIGYHLNNQWFAPIQFIHTRENDTKYTLTDLKKDIDDTLILIPSKIFEDQCKRYTIISKSWKYRLFSGKYELPNISLNCFNEIMDE